MMSDDVLLLVIGILAFLFAGEPDLPDSLIKYLDTHSKCEVGK